MLQNIISVLKLIFITHKWKVLLFFPLTAAFSLYLFAYEDLSDLITNQVSIASKNSLYLQFDDLSLALLPQPGIRLEKVIVESSFAPALEFADFAVAPALLSLISGKAGGKVVSSDLFAGDLSLNLGQSNKLKLEEGDEYRVNLELEDLDLKELTNFLKENFSFLLQSKGKGNLAADLSVDPSFKVQPDGSFVLILDKMNIPDFEIPLANFGSFPLPGLSFSKVILNGQVKDRSLIIKEGKLGSAKDQLSGSIDGDLSMEIRPGGRVRWGSYNLKVNLSFKNKLKKELDTILSIAESFGGIGKNYKFPTLNGVRYGFRVSGRSFQDANPRFSAL